jgi:hypothetical protein
MLQLTDDALPLPTLTTLLVALSTFSRCQNGNLQLILCQLVGNHVELRGGQICGFAGREETDEANADTFVLDLGTKVWSRANC